MRRVLKDTGSIYLHCDPTASHYLKMIMDVIFGKKNFRNEIIWLYKTGGTSKRWFSRKHDIIFFYSKTNKYHFNHKKEKSYLSHRYGFSNVEIFEDENGIYRWAGVRDVWDIPALRGNQPEQLGYPTQKPQTLIERIIETSSNEGDIVLDPFCGCGTTVHAAELLNRQWIGIDISQFSAGLIRNRITGNFKHLDRTDISAIGCPLTLVDAQDLARNNAFEVTTRPLLRFPVSNGITKSS